MLAITLPILGGLVFLVVVGTFRRRIDIREWHDLHAVHVDRQVDELREHVQLDQVLAGRLLQKAHASSDDPARSRALLARCLATVEAAIPDRLTRTATMARLARMASALVPVVPMQVRALRLSATAAVAAAGWWLHVLAVSFEDRFLLRLGTLRWAYVALGAESRRVGRRVLAQPAPRPRVFARAEGCVSDLGTLDHEHVECYRELLTSVARQPLCCVETRD